MLDSGPHFGGSRRRPLLDPRAGGQRAPRPNASAIALLALLMLGAGALYLNHAGSLALGASESYSALAAAAPSWRAALAVAEQFDPGKPPLYHLLLHGYALGFGAGDYSLRLFSVLWALAQLPLLFALGCQLFERRTALGATLLWALCPLAFMLAPWVRMYSMFVTLYLALSTALAAWERAPTVPRAGALAACAALLLYVHLYGVLFFGASLALVLRAQMRGFRDQRGAWLAMLLGAAIFLPFVPAAMAQTHQLLGGHWLDWLARGSRLGPGARLLVSAGAAAAALYLLAGAAWESDPLEPMRFCLLLSVLPACLATVATMLWRPMLAVRYLAPACPLALLAFTWALGRLYPRVRGPAILLLSLLGLVLYAHWQPLRQQPWPAVARAVRASGASRPVIFEAGPAVLEGGAGAPPQAFPDGYYRVPFERYCGCANPRLALRPTAADFGLQLQALARRYGMVWLISARAPADLARALGPGLAFAAVVRGRDLALLAVRAAPAGPR